MGVHFGPHATQRKARDVEEIERRGSRVTTCLWASRDSWTLSPAVTPATETADTHARARNGTGYERRTEWGRKKAWLVMLTERVTHPLTRANTFTPSHCDMNTTHGAFNMLTDVRHSITRDERYCTKDKQTDTLCCGSRGGIVTGE